jgi:hypothetical protein
MTTSTHDQEQFLTDKRALYLRQFRDHQPGSFGGCPICGGTGRCDLRREAADMLDELDVDLSQPAPSRLSEAMKELHLADWRAHRDCGPDCFAGRVAWQHLIADGVDPATVE